MSADPYDKAVVQDTLERERRSRFREKHPAAAKTYDEAERAQQELVVAFTRMLQATESREVQHYAEYVTRHAAFVAHQWAIAKRLYTEFVMRDCPPMRARFDADGNVIDIDYEMGVDLARDGSERTAAVTLERTPEGMRVVDPFAWGGWRCSLGCGWADRSSHFERNVGDSCPGCHQGKIVLLPRPAKNSDRVMRGVEWGEVVSITGPDHAPILHVVTNAGEDREWPVDGETHHFDGAEVSRLEPHITGKLVGKRTITKPDGTFKVLARPAKVGERVMSKTKRGTFDIGEVVDIGTHGPALRVAIDGGRGMVVWSLSSDADPVFFLDGTRVVP